MAHISEFHSELDGLELHFPGQQIVQFSNDDALRTFMHHQYPNWERAGNVSSIPIGRMPRVFLSGDQMIDSLTKRFAGLQKGEAGEIQVYEYLLKWGQTLPCGICLFPNIDGNHFETIQAHVEIDMTFVHPQKGIFVFSIKNGSCIKERKLVKDMAKHVAFIRLLCIYKQNLQASETLKIPIHGIVCSFQHNISQELLEDFGYFETSGVNEIGGRFLLQPNDMTAIDFPSKLTDILATIPSVEEKNSIDGIHVFVSRLVALNSLDGSLALIHEKIISNEIQTIRVKSKEVADVLGKQFPNQSTAQEKGVVSSDTEESLLRDHVSHGLEIIKPASGGKNKKSVILWSKEQLDVIYSVGKTLFNPNKGCRILVTGPKGSGKTVIMIYLAKLAESIFAFHRYLCDKSIAIYDGRFGNSQILFDSLRKKYAGSGIDVLTCKPDSQNDNSRKYELIFIDEMNSLRSRFWLDYKYLKNQKVLIFSSIPNLSSEFKHFELSKTLRSTCSIAKFCEDFRCLDPNCMMFPAVPSHNLVGTPPELKCISVNSEVDSTHQEFVEESVSVIMNILEKAKGLHDILVTPFIYPITLNRIIREISKNGVLYQYVNPADSLSGNVDIADCSTGSRSVPGITFVTGNHVDGAEYGAVIVLIDRCLPCFFDQFIFDSVYIAITRATVLLSIVVNDSAHPPVIPVKSSGKSLGSFIREMPKSDIYAYNCSTERTSEDLSARLKEIVATNYCQTNPILIVGDCWKIPSEFHPIEKRIGLNQVNNFWFLGPNEELLVLCPDLTTFSHYLRNCLSNGSLLQLFSCFVFSIQDMRQFNADVFDRHQLFYLMWQYNMFQSPLYICSLSKLTKSNRKCSFLICDYIKSEAPLPHSGFESSQRNKYDHAENLQKVYSAIEIFF